jgi:hypothetical protein
MRSCVSITMLLLSVAAAHAQAPPINSQPVPGPQATVRCAPVVPPNAEQGTRSPPGQTTGQSREPLSDRLAQSDGVMCPPSNIDPQMQKDPPAEGKTPVIPPPGSPGGDPTVRPK